MPVSSQSSRRRPDRAHAAHVDMKSLPVAPRAQKVTVTVIPGAAAGREGRPAIRRRTQTVVQVSAAGRGLCVTARLGGYGRDSPDCLAFHNSESLAA